MKKRKKKLGLYHVILLFIAIYIVFTLIKQEIQINKLEAERTNKNNTKLQTSKQINDLSLSLSKLEANEVYLYEYIEKKDEEKEILSKDKYDENQLNKLRNEIKELENRLINSDLTEYIEMIARGELKMVKSGEIIFVDKSKTKE